LEGDRDVFYGGGIYLRDSEITIDDCTITGNSANYGGGVHFSNSTVNITNSEIRDNITPKQELGDTGGGICGEASSGKIENCIISQNFSGLGGGIYCFMLFPDIINCQITDNIALTSAGEGKGGGIYFFSSSPAVAGCEISYNDANRGGGMDFFNSSPEVTYCTIQGNAAKNVDYYAGLGGGICCKSNTKPKITDCNIRNNIALKGGGIYCDSAYPIVSSCIIEKNSSEEGGGLYFKTDSAPVFTDCIITENIADVKGGGFRFEKDNNARILNCLVVGNYSNEGGAIFSFNASPMFTLCTIFGNNSNLNNGFYAWGKETTLTNSIIWNDGANLLAGDITVNNSCIEGGYEGEGNIDQNPMFVSGPWGDHYLSQLAAGQETDSPCIDTGSEIHAVGFDPSEYITRTDGLFDTGKVDIGYHYPPHVKFGLAAIPVRFGHADGDELTLLLDLETAPAEINADIYIILLDPAMNFWSAISWNKGLQPLLANFTLPADLDIEDVPMIAFTIPSTKPPVDMPGTYTFYLTASKPGTPDFISNIASIDLTVE
jgi:hypothetical protein